ncbi:MAG: response regulator transcription factor [Hyphomicrobiaceae bacterium]|nr:response regulator transcription factor [Hyphomicrobiaceae bacterium]
MPAHRIMIVDDHPLFRGALRQSLTSAFDACIEEADSLDVLSEKLAALESVDLIVLDLSMPGVQGFSGLLFLRAQYPEVPVVVCSANDDVAVIRRCIEFGAAGYVPKSQPVERIREAVTTVLSGGVWTPPDLNLTGEPDRETEALVGRLATLTPQQVRVLMMLGEGLLNKQIAYKLSVSEATIKAHVSAILQKLGVDSRTQAVIAINKIDGGAWEKLAG